MTSLMTPAAERVLIRASAGTGKTFQLSNHYIKHLLNGAAPDAILATTFTRKAAGEIQERIFARLCEASTSDEKAALLAARVDVGPVGIVELRQRIKETLHELARNMHRLRVTTLDAFCAKLATAYALELGLPSDWRILDDVDVIPLKLAAVDELLQHARPDETAALLHLLDKGDTKSRVVTRILNAVSNFHDVYLDANRRPEPWDRVPDPQFTSSERRQTAIQTIGELAPKFPHKKGVEALQRVVDDALAEDWKSVASATVVGKAVSGDANFYRKPIEPMLVDALAVIGRHAGAVMLEELRSQTRATFQLLDSFDSRYQQRKLDRGGLTFTDLTRHLAREGQPIDPSRGIGFRLDGELKHVLLDEFQDTSLPQWTVLKPIVEAASRQFSGSIFCVGDLKQAIYGWRGGVAAIFDRVSQELAVEPVSMDRSFRSSPVVIQTVNQLFNEIPLSDHFSQPDRLALHQWNTQFVGHSAESDADGYVQVRVTPQPEPRKSKFSREISRWTAGFVHELVQKHPNRSIGILTRRNHVASELVAYLRGRGIDASDEGRERLTDSAAVQLLVSLLTLVDHPEDTAARFHLATSPLAMECGISHHGDDEAAATLADHLRNEVADTGFGRTLHRWARQLLPQCGPRDVARMGQLIELAEHYDTTLDPTSAGLLRLIEEARCNDPRPSLVRVMTVHLSKGLEFDIVVLCELDEPMYQLERGGYVAARPDPAEPPDRIMRYRSKSERQTFPSEVEDVFSEAATAEMTEGLCRFYVAATRARSALYLLVAPTSRSQSQSETIKPADLIRMQLADVSPFEPDTVAAEFGTPTWDAGAKVSGESRAAGPPIEVRFRSGPSLARKIPTITPSELAHQHPSGMSIDQSSESGETFRQIIPASTAGADRGTLIHRWLEEIVWLEDTASPGFDRCLELGNELGIDRRKVQTVAESFEAVMSEDAVRATLSKSRYASEQPLPILAVRNELRFATRDATTTSNRLCVGTIDRLVLLGNNHPEAAEIIDWKTDFIRDEAQLEEKVDQYGHQLAMYADAVAGLFEISREQITGRLVFLAIDRQVSLSLRTAESPHRKP